MATPGPIPSPAAAIKGIDDSLRQRMVQKLDEAIVNTRLENNKTGADVELTIFNKADNVDAYKTLMQKCFYVIANSHRGQPQRGQAQGQQQQRQLLVNQQQQIQQQAQPQLLHQGGFVQQTQQQQVQAQQQGLSDHASSSLLQQQQQAPGQQQQGSKMMPQHPVPPQQLPAGQQMPAGQQTQQMRMQVSSQQQMMLNQQQMQQQQQGGPMIMRPGINQGQGVSQLQQRLTANRQPPMRSGMPMQMMGGQRIHMGMGGAGGPPNMGPGAMMAGARGPPPMYNPHAMNQGGSPGNMAMMGHSPMNQNQYLHSPAQQQGMGSPARHMVPSPMASVNTPQNPNDPQSVAAQEDQAYLEKVRQMGKYIEPLRKAIDRNRNEDQANLQKMKSLMEILTNHNKRIKMESLCRCEAVLKEILDQEGGSSGAAAETSTANPLFEAIVSLRAKGQPQGQMNHVLQKTFGAPLESIYGTEISLPPLPKKRKVEPRENAAISVTSTTTGDIPDIVQGEIARLRSQFKVNLDPAQPVPKSGMIHLVCQLEDPNLPSVPPLSVTLPPGYPFDASPSCETEMTDYFATSFLGLVQEALDARLSKMPARYTLSQLLSAWEMSVRAACSPRQQQVPVTQMSLFMGL